jgi:hypothetical protein
LTDSKKWHGLSPKIKPYGSLIVAMSEIWASLYQWTPSYNVGDVAANGCAREKTCSMAQCTYGSELTGNNKNACLDHLMEPSSRGICRCKDNNALEVVVIHV